MGTVWTMTPSRMLGVLIATLFKKEQPVPEKDGRSRAVTGDKGLGRLSAARLGSEIAVVTKTADGPVLSFSLNWDQLLDSEDIGNVGFQVSHLSAETFEMDHGTRIRIRALRSIWGKEEIENLRQNLARLVSPFATMKDFSLRLIVPGDLDRELGPRHQPSSFHGPAEICDRGPCG